MGGVAAQCDDAAGAELLRGSQVTSASTKEALKRLGNQLGEGVL
jgi:hypothetical protein